MNRSHLKWTPRPNRTALDNAVPLLLISLGIWLSLAWGIKGYQEALPAINKAVRAYNASGQMSRAEMAEIGIVMVDQDSLKV